MTLIVNEKDALCIEIFLFGAIEKYHYSSFGRYGFNKL